MTSQRSKAPRPLCQRTDGHSCPHWASDHPPPPLPPLGVRINRRASLGARLVELRAQIPELEKLSRRTPPKTLVAERARVAAAAVALLARRAELAAVEVEYATLASVTEEVVHRG